MPLATPTSVDVAASPRGRRTGWCENPFSHPDLQESRPAHRPRIIERNVVAAPRSRRTVAPATVTQTLRGTGKTPAIRRGLTPLALLLTLCAATTARAQSTKPVATRAATTQPATSTSRGTTQSQPAKRLPYTSPTSTVRGSSAIAAAVGTLGAARTTTGGREAAEASVGARLPGTGAPGLSAPQAFTAASVVGQPGLQRGLAIGFGPLPQQNLFTRSINPITGPTGACNILITAGFNPAVCRR